jgi:hypothetical protein
MENLTRDLFALEDLRPGSLLTQYKRLRHFRLLLQGHPA